jgi:hypothetical protein
MNYPRVVVALVLGLAASGCASSGGGDGKPGSVVGRVVDNSGKGVRGTAVRIVPVDGSEPRIVVTDSVGRFVIEQVPPGRGMTVEAVKQGNVLTTRGSKSKVNVSSGGRTDVGAIELKAGG